MKETWWRYQETHQEVLQRSRKKRKRANKRKLQELLGENYHLEPLTKEEERILREIEGSI